MKMFSKYVMVYIAAPYTGNNIANARKAFEAAEELLKLGYTPYAPHQSMLWDIYFYHEPDFYYEYDLKILRLCDCVLRMPGESKGADGEVKFAKEHSIPVYYSIAKLVKEMK